MKKRVQLAILLLFILLSCTDNADMTERVTGTVGFHAADVAPSRAAVVGLPGLQTGFRVNAYVTGTEEWSVVKDNPNTKPGLMWNQEVTWTGSAWTYTPVKYWPGNNGKVSFFAWNEIFNDPDIFSVSEASMAGAPQLTYTVPNAQLDQKDLVVAMATDKIATGGAVSLTFGHVLSRIGFTAKLEDHYEGVTVTITSLKVKYATDAVESKGIYTFGETNPWLPPTGKAYMSHTGDGDVVVGGAGIPLNNDAPPAETDLTTDTRANYLMLLPQTVADGDVMIEVKWTVNGGIPNSQTVNLPAQTWTPGYRYDYSLRVSLTNGITFDPVQVNPWETPLHQPCTITYNANGGTDEDIVEHRVTGVEYPVGDYIFEREYYRFREEWNTEPDGKGTTYRAGEYITCTGDLTLYAQWRSTLPNCYMVKPAGDQVTFPVMLAYEDNGASTTLRIGGTHTGEFTIEEVWDPNDLVTATVTGEGPSATVTVTTASGSGNALVAIKAGSNIAWSYHIWVTDYEGDNTVTMYNGHVFMDRNLGATANDLSTAAYGLFYQWGRKDPFRNSGDFTSTATSDENGTIEYSIKHPDHFIKGVNGSSYDWHYGSRKNYLWNEQTTNNKTIYDPCPAGWRVPTFKDNIVDKAYSPWREYDDDYRTELAPGGWVWNNTGYEFTHKNNYVAFYPAAGYRYNTNGTCEYGGEYGRYWGAATTPAQYGGNTAYALSFRSGHVGYTLDYRASGFSVRCVQE